MRKIALAVAIPLTLVGGATVYTSTQVESTARDAVEQANIQLREMSVGAGADVAVKMLSFEGGLLSSSARYQVDIEVQDSDGEPRQYAVLLEDRIE
ncbi:MAG: YdgA family protein, partial [Gammaproteobacteria bacterium]|nr:YdgA family protein [Gammaproteobacteria bacterium]